MGSFGVWVVVISQSVVLGIKKHSLQFTVYSSMLYEVKTRYMPTATVEAAPVEQIVVRAMPEYDRPSNARY